MPAHIIYFLVVFEWALSPAAQEKHKAAQRACLQQYPYRRGNKEKAKGEYGVRQVIVQLAA